MRFTHRLKMLLQFSPHLASPQWGEGKGEGVGQASRLSCKWVAAISLLFLLLLSSFFVTPVFATTTVTDVTDLTAGQGILPNSPATALLKVQITFALGDNLIGIEAAVTDADGMNTGHISELAIYSDTNNNGFFDSGDTRIAYKTNPGIGTAYGGANSWTWSSISEAHYDAPSNIWYYFIVIETSGSISHGDAFHGWLGAINGAPVGGTSGIFYGSTSSPVTCECKVVDIYYTESDTNLFHPPLDLVSGDTETYWKPNYLSYAIAQEMTEPNETTLDGLPHHIYALSETERYSFLDITAVDTDLIAAASNSLKFERRRKLMGMNTPTAVLGIKVAGNNQYQSYPSAYYDNDYFDTMVIQFTDTDSANFDPQTMLFDIMSGNPGGSGVAVYADTNDNDIFDAGDTVLNILNTSSWSGNVLTLKFSPPASSNLQAVIPHDFNADLTDSTGHDTTGVDFFVVLRGDPSAIKYGADFTAQVIGMSFWAGATGTAVGARPPANYATWYVTKEIKAVFELSDYTGTRVDPGITFPVIGINVNKGAAPERLERFTLYLKATGTYFNPNNDLTPLADLTAPGVSVLDRSGDVVPTVTSGWSGPVLVLSLGGNWYATTVTFSPFASVPSDDIGGNPGPEYFINLTTSDTFGYNKKIIAAIPDEEFIFNSGNVNTDGTVLITNANVDYGSNSRV